jgi:sugar phosphate isomerase/epimerase
LRTGFYTAVLADQALADIASWAAAAGFDALEVDVEAHLADPAQAPAIVDDVRARGVDVCAFTYFGNLLDADQSARLRHRTSVEAAVDAAAASGVGIVVIFPGRDESASEDANYDQLAAYLTALAERAAPDNVKIAMENWPGPGNDYLATTPRGWAKLFALAPHANLGLLFDPSHLVWQGIGHEPALRAFAERVFLVHAKDTAIDRSRLQETGYFGRGWWRYRLPGHGEIDWPAMLGLLRELGFDGVVSIEHEDADWGATEDGDLRLRQDGLGEGLRVLHAAMAGSP